MFIGFILVSAPGLHKISNTTTATFTCSQMLKEIAEGTQILKSKEDALNLLKQKPLTVAK